MIKTETICEKSLNVKKRFTHLHGVGHAVVIIAAIDLGEKVLTQLKKNKGCHCCGQSCIF